MDARPTPTPPAALSWRVPARSPSEWSATVLALLMDDDHAITRWLDAAADGDPDAPQRLLAHLHAGLRQLAAAKMAALPPGNTLQPTALVNEAWMRLERKGPEQGADRARFFASAARAMRDILVEQARRKAAAKRGGDRGRVELEVAEPVIDGAPGTVLDVHAALAALEAEDPRKAQLVDLRYFAGLSTEETAAILGVSTRTVEAQWQFVKRWLYVRLKGHD